ncbi:hypothetical protein RIF29_04385 [Crotalaria pallida]|uniref:Peptidase A1 domain-containing protein n=1 Tax=Crotalaria pallida TaxID=3830 RepID=A0AAN9J1Q1_CROPI
MASSPFVLLLLFLHTLFIIFLQNQTSASSLQQNFVIMPLKIQTLPHGTPSTRKLSFQHNVTLTVSLTVGTPPQSVTMVLDTGSELSWLRCKKLQNLTNIFNPLLSSSYTPIPCFSSVCKIRTRDLPIPPSCDSKKLCHVTVSYADATSTEGNLATETFSIANSSQPGTIFGCMDSGFSSDPDEDSKTTGLMGLNLGSLSFVTQMKLRKFSYCISRKDSSGVLLFGEATFPWLGPLKYTPLVKSSDPNPLPYFDRVAYTVKLKGIWVGGKALQLPESVFVPDHTGAGQTIVDSGTQFSLLLGPVYAALKKEFMAQTNGTLTPLNEANFVFQGVMDLCYRVPSGRAGDIVSGVPAVTLVFEGAELRVSGERLLYRVGDVARGRDWVYCFTFGNSELEGNEAYVIGHHHQQNVWVEFDLVNSRVGFADTRCELARQRLGLGP